jgi:hypothetical protein
VNDGFALDFDDVVVVVELPLLIETLGQVPGDTRVDDGLAGDLAVPATA